MKLVLFDGVVKEKAMYRNVRRKAVASGELETSTLRAHCVRRQNCAKGRSLKGVFYGTGCPSFLRARSRAVVKGNSRFLTPFAKARTGSG